MAKHSFPSDSRSSSQLDIVMGLNADPLGRGLLDVEKTLKHTIRNLSNNEDAIKLRAEVEIINAKNSAQIVAATKRKLQDLMKVSAARLSELEKKNFNNQQLHSYSSSVHGKTEKAYWKERVNYAMLEKQLSGLPKEEFDLFIGKRRAEEFRNLEKELKKQQEQKSQQDKKLSEYLASVTGNPKKDLATLEQQMHRYAWFENVKKRAERALAEQGEVKNQAERDLFQKRESRRSDSVALETEQKRLEQLKISRTNAENERADKLAAIDKKYDRQIAAKEKANEKLVANFSKADDALKKAIQKIEQDAKKQEADLKNRIEELKKAEAQAVSARDTAINALLDKYSNQKGFQKLLSRIEELRTKKESGGKWKAIDEQRLQTAEQDWEKRVGAFLESKKKIESALEKSLKDSEKKIEDAQKQIDKLPQQVEEQKKAETKKSKYDILTDKNTKANEALIAKNDKTIADLNQARSDAKATVNKTYDDNANITNKEIQASEGRIGRLQESIRKATEEIKAFKKSYKNAKALIEQNQKPYTSILNNAELKEGIKSLDELRAKSASLKDLIANTRDNAIARDLRAQVAATESNISALKEELAIRQKMKDYSSFFGYVDNKAINDKAAKIQQEIENRYANIARVQNWKNQTAGARSVEEYLTSKDLAKEYFGVDFSSRKRANDAIRAEIASIREMREELKQLQVVMQRLNEFQPPTFKGFYESARKHLVQPVRDFSNAMQGIYQSSQSLTTALPKAFELLDLMPNGGLFKRLKEKTKESFAAMGGNGVSLAQLLDFSGHRPDSSGIAPMLNVLKTGLAGLGTVLGGAGIAVTAFTTVISGAEQTLISFAKNSLDAQNALYIMGKGMHSSIDDMKELSVLTQVAGVNMSSVQIAMRRVNAQLVKTTEGSALARKTLTDFGARLYDNNGRLKQGMPQLEELAKAYQNAKKEGREAEFRYKVGGRYWDNDFIVMIDDFAANMKSMRQIVKSRLADPELAYNTRGAMYGLEAQQKQMWTSFSSAFIPVISYVAPQLRERFAALTSVIEANADNIKQLGYWLGDVAVSFANLSTAAIKAGTALLTYITPKHSAEDTVTDVLNDKEFNKKRDDITKEFYKVMLGKRAAVPLIDRPLKEELEEMSRKTPNDFMAKYKTNSANKPFETPVVPTINSILETIDAQNSRLSFSGDLILDNEGKPVIDQKIIEALSKGFVTEEDYNYLKNTPLAAAIDEKTKTVDTEKLGDFWLEMLDTAIPEFKEFLIDTYIKEFEEQIKKERGSKEYSEWLKRKDKVIADLKKASLRQIKGAGDNLLVHNDSPNKIAAEAYKFVLGMVERQAIQDTFDKARVDYSEIRSKDKDATKSYADTFDEMTKKAKNFTQENKKMEYDLEYGTYAYARSLAALRDEWQETQKNFAKLDETAVTNFEKQEAKKIKDKSEENYEWKEKLSNKQFNDELKQSYKQTFDTIYALSHSAHDKEMRDIREWFRAEQEKTKLLKDEGKEKERLAATTAQAVAKELDSIKKVKDELRGNVKTLEEEFFDLTHSQFDKEMREIDKKYNEKLRKTTDPAMRERIEYMRNLEKAKLISQNKDNQKYFQLEDWQKKPNAKNPNTINVVYADDAIKDNLLNQFWNRSGKPAQPQAKVNTPVQPYDFEKSMVDTASYYDKQITDKQRELELAKERGVSDDRILELQSAIDELTAEKVNSLERINEEGQSQLRSWNEWRNLIDSFGGDVDAAKNEWGKMHPTDVTTSYSGNGGIDIVYADQAQMPNIDFNTDFDEQIENAVDEQMNSVNTIQGYMDAEIEVRKKYTEQLKQWLPTYVAAGGKLVTPLEDIYSTMEMAEKFGNFNSEKDVVPMNTQDFAAEFLSTIKKLVADENADVKGVNADNVAEKPTDQQLRRQQGIERGMEQQQSQIQDEGFTPILNSIYNVCNTHLPKLDKLSNIKGLDDLPSTLKDLKRIVEKLAPIENLEKAIKSFSDAVDKIKESASAPPTINVSAPVTLTLDGAYILNNNIITKLVGDVTEEIANAITDAVNKGILTSRQQYNTI